ncbi:hypothetical protein N9015_01975, partial [Akkermansiaceae bacterium]|nr:hypothetical protein [Akkermansiaceae bacterium]
MAVLSTLLFFSIFSFGFLKLAALFLFRSSTFAHHLFYLSIFPLCVLVSAVLSLLPFCVLVSFLGDTSLKVSNDVIRAIHDTQIEMARPVLAALLDDQSIGAPQRPVSRMILRRLIHTAYRIPNEQNLLRVIKAAVNPLFPIEERKEAMRLLSIWENPPVVDQSLGYHSPLSPRDPAIMEKVLGKHISILL